jgi:hypothetical protein
MTTNSMVAGRAAGALLTAVIIALTAATAYIHFSLGGTLFLLNALGYTALGVAYVVAAFAPIPLIRRLSWLPRIGLAGYAMLTIGAYLAMGPYFALGWIAKAIEITIVGLVTVDLLTTYGGPRGLVSAVAASAATLWARREPNHG